MAVNGVEKRKRFTLKKWEIIRNKKDIKELKKKVKF